MSDVIVVGGGVAGLRCAVALADAGLRVSLFEAGPRLGGRAASWREGPAGDEVDLGPHVLLTDYRHLRAFVERLGTADQVLWQRQPLITLLDQGRVLRMKASGWPAPLHGLVNLPQAWSALGWRDLISNVRIGWRALRWSEARGLQADAIDALGWLRSAGVGERAIEWFWTPAARALLNVPLDACSAAALWRVTAMLVRRSGYAFGFPRHGLADLFEPARRVIEEAGGRVQLASPVRRVRLVQGRCVGVELAGGRVHDAQAVVLALPPAALAAVAPPRWEQPARWVRVFQPSPYLSTYLWFDRKLTRERFWARIWRPGDLNLDFYDLSNIRPELVEGPSLIAANAIHVSSGESDEALVSRTLQELAEFAPGVREAQLRHASVHRVPMAIPCPAPGSEQQRPSCITPFPGLWKAGDWLATGLPCSMESAARAGALAAEAVAHALGRELRVAQPVPGAQGFARWFAVL